MIVAMLVLVSVLTALIGIAFSFFRPRPISAIDESEIRTAQQLDAAMTTQRSIRVAELQRRMVNRDYFVYAIFGLALLIQLTAYAVDHFSHPSIMAISILPGFFTGLTVRSARRRDAQRQLDAVIGRKGVLPVA